MIKSFKATCKTNNSNKKLGLHYYLLLGLILEVLSLIYVKFFIDKYEITSNLKVILYFLNIILILYIPFKLRKFMLTVMRKRKEYFYGINIKSNFYVKIFNGYIEFEFLNINKKMFFDDIKQIQFKQDNIIIVDKNELEVNIKILENLEVVQKELLEKTKNKKLIH